MGTMSKWTSACMTHGRTWNMDALSGVIWDIHKPNDGFCDRLLFDTKVARVERNDQGGTVSFLDR
jgi:hypothetical protein